MAKARLVRSTQFVNKLKTLRTETALAMAPAMEKAAKLVVDRMVYYVPKVTHALEHSIGYEFYSGAIRGGQIENETRVIIFAGNAQVPYAPVVEFAKHGKPFFYPAFRASRKQVRRIIGQGVKAAVQGVARRP